MYIKLCQNKKRLLTILYFYQYLNEILNVGGYREEVIPSPISNLVVKLFIADNTAGFPGGNVGRCQLLRSFFLLFFSISLSYFLFYLLFKIHIFYY